MSPGTPICHVVALPYPGRGHINPMLNLCRLILRHRPNFQISFIVTEEWLGFLRLAPPPPQNLSFYAIPNVIPSEIGRGKDFAGFYEAVQTKMQAPVERLMVRLMVRLPERKPSVIIYDTYVSWAVEMGNRLNIPVASLYTMSATVFSIFYHFDLILHNGQSGPNFSEAAKQQTVNYIPGISSIRVADLPTPVHSNGREVLPRALEAIKLASKAQYVLFTSVYELESQVLDSLREYVPVKLYALGFAIPYFDVIENCSSIDVDKEEKPEYMKWLDAKPVGSVLYISLGSFLSVSNAQLDEIIAGVCASGVSFMWVARGEDWEIDSDNGIVVPWCDQLKVLCHPSVGGFWTHCGWNSIKEGAFAGVPMLTFPIFWDQSTNSKMIVEEWKTGVRVRDTDVSFVRREDITKLVLRVMDSQSEEAKERRRQAKEIQNTCRNASASGGSSDMDILAFIRDISEY